MDRIKIEDENNQIQDMANSGVNTIGKKRSCKGRIPPYLTSKNM